MTPAGRGALRCPREIGEQFLGFCFRGPRGAERYGRRGSAGRARLESGLAG